MAYFDDAASTIYVFRPLWEKMDSLNQAALVHHELHSRQMRRRGERSSVAARLTVGHIFALNGPDSLFAGLTSSSRQFVGGGFAQDGDGEDNSVFYRTRLGGVGGEVRRLQFIQLGGRPLLTKTWVDVPFAELGLAIGRSDSDPRVLGCIVRSPGVDQYETLPVQGTMTTGLKLVYQAKTGEPVRLTLLSDESVVSDVIIGPPSNCADFLTDTPKRRPLRGAPLYIN
ncbi:MAG: hypothetical protein HC902_07930 [Calothrix sp. SM1_5_4]|nr:hypothetical protein [Calothrix sp. SM1_5_4]